jgi:addiction module RelE/StbE family toxin
LKLSYSTHFKKDYQVIQKSGRDISQLDNIIRRLANSENNFSPPYKVYPMDFGWLKNYFTLYLAPDWALIYKIDTEKNEVYLVRTGHPKDIQH